VGGGEERRRGVPARWHSVAREAGMALR
jgi:hypothetical protein